MHQMKINGRGLRHIILFLALALACSAPLAAQQRLSDDEVQRGLSELRNYKHRVLAQELRLDKDAQQAFFDVYDSMDDELLEVATETREMERRALADSKASDTELEAVSRSLFEQKKRESDIELKYYDRLREVLTPRQLVALKSAERKISMTLANYHGRQKNQRGGSPARPRR